MEHSQLQGLHAARSLQQLALYELLALPLAVPAVLLALPLQHWEAPGPLQLLAALLPLWLWTACPDQQQTQQQQQQLELVQQGRQQLAVGPPLSQRALHRLHPDPQAPWSGLPAVLAQLQGGDKRRAEEQA